MLVYKSIKWNLNEDEKELFNKVRKNLSLGKDDIKECYLDRVSTDARNKNDIFQMADVAFSLVNDKDFETILKNGKGKVIAHNIATNDTIEGSEKLDNSPVVVGFGPCGLFAAYELAIRGYKPIIIERGKCVEDRDEDVRKLWEKGELCEESNVLFGEGGAGTFSDGKLTSRSKDHRSRKVLEIFEQNGAQSQILRDAKPHIGSDVLKIIVKNMREKIIELGGTFLFETKLVDFRFDNGILKSVIVENKGISQEINVNVCVLAIGHSARDTYEMIAQKGLEIVPKSFAIGVRIEHEQSYIDEVQYGKFAKHPKLGRAEYQLSDRTSDDRGVYTFCMCPGGYVIASGSEKDGVAVNGMSMSNRDAKNANSAVIVQVGPEDYGFGVLDGVEFQREIEKRAFSAGGGKYFAPVQRAGDFFDKAKNKSFGKVQPSYLPGVENANLWDVLPNWCSSGIAEGIKSFSKKMRGFDDADAVLTGVETRTSAPLRIMRNKEDFQSNECKGLYPAGEGAGYAGGIVSSAIDGIKTAEQIIEKYSSLG